MRMFAGVGGLIFLLVYVLAAIGWVLNLINVVSLFLSNAPFESITLFNVGQVIGIFFPPLGAILGFVG